MNIYTKCYPPSGPIACLPAGDTFVAVTDPGQNIDFTIRDASVFDTPGIQFAEGTFTCTRMSSQWYTCTQTANTPRGVFLKYTIRVVNAFPNDPYAFVRN